MPAPAPLLRRHSVEQPRLFDDMFDSMFEGESVRGTLFSVTSPMLARSVSFTAVQTKR